MRIRLRHLLLAASVAGAAWPFQPHAVASDALQAAMRSTQQVEVYRHDIARTGRQFLQHLESVVFEGAGARPDAAIERSRSAAGSSRAAGSAEGACTDHFPRKIIPESVPGATRLLCFEGYAAFYNGPGRHAVFTVQRLLPDKMRDRPNLQRSENFYEEARLPEQERALLADYRGSGFDRGHLAPAGDALTPAAMAQSFSLANMTPQDGDMNRGAWAEIESATRHFVRRAKGPVYVYTGPLYAKNPRRIGSGVPVPDKLFKVVYDASADRAWGFVMANRPGQRIQRLNYWEVTQQGVPDVLALSGVSPP